MACTSGVGNSVTTRFAQAGSIISAANYLGTEYWYNGGASTWSTNASTGQTVAGLVSQPTAVTDGNQVVLDYIAPYEAGSYGRATGYGASGRDIRTIGFAYAVNGQYDGFYISVGAGTFSGTIQVYGYNH